MKEEDLLEFIDIWEWERYTQEIRAVIHVPILVHIVDINIFFNFLL